jgi:PAS domain S-box-containing protein
MIGYDENELKELTFSDITHPDDLSIGFSSLNKLLDDEFIKASFEKRYIRKDNQIIWVNILTSLIRDVNHLPKFFITQIIDITERKRLEEDIRESEERFRMVFENAFDGISIYSEDPDPLKRRLFECNEQYAALSGRSRYELLKFGNTLEFQITLEDNANDNRLESLDKRKAYQGFFSWIRPDGKENVIEYMAMPVLWRGKPYSISVDRDITVRKQTEKDLIEAKERAEQSDKLKSEFLAQMSHEIRTPLTVIVGNVGYLNDFFDDQLDSDTKGCFNSIETASERIIRTIGLILNSAELQTGGYKPKFVKIDIDKKILKKLYREHLFIADKKALKLIYNCKSEDTEVIIDEYSTTQIISNLLDNAIKFTKKGMVEILLERNKKGNLIVEIKDTGIGISKKFQAEIFEPFSQEEQGYTRSYEGTGLGMLIVKKYCELNNITIELESKKSVGSTFRIIFNNGFELNKKVIEVQ